MQRARDFHRRLASERTQSKVWDAWVWLTFTRPYYADGKPRQRQELRRDRCRLLTASGQTVIQYTYYTLLKKERKQSTNNTYTDFTAKKDYKNNFALNICYQNRTPYNFSLAMELFILWCALGFLLCHPVFCWALFAKFDKMSRYLYISFDVAP